MNTKPYYEEAGITIYHGDCREILPQLGRFDLLLTDPPYGIGLGSMSMGSGAKRKSFAPFDWDRETPDMRTLGLAISMANHSIIWGGNYFGLPASRCWLAWDKIQEFSGADFELAWTNLDRPCKAFRLSRVEAYSAMHKEHPAQKPHILMAWSITQADNCTGAISTVLDPYIGSGTTLLAAKTRGICAVGCDISEEYCEIAANRLRQSVMNFEGVA